MAIQLFRGMDNLAIFENCIEGLVYHIIEIDGG